MTSAYAEVDIAIVGLGLAGAALAWAARAHDLRIAIIDDAANDAASQVAAGLNTPVTGGKLKPQPDFDALAKTATTHYEHVGAATAHTVLTPRPAIRVLSSEREQSAWRTLQHQQHDLIESCDVAPDYLRAEGPRVIMRDAARVDIAGYVAATLAHFSSSVRRNATFADEQLDIRNDRIELTTMKLRARHLVFCRGFRDRQNRYFPDLQWRGAKGEILMLHCEAFDPRYTIHGNGMWMTSSGNDTVLAGATYTWDSLDGTPTLAARHELARKAKSLIGLPFSVVDQRAAVRPNVVGR